MQVQGFKLYEMLEALKAMKDEKIRDWKANMAIINNKRIIQSQIDLFEELKEPTKEFNEFEKERNALAVKHSKKDPSGNPLLRQTTQGPVYDIIDVDLFNTDLAVLIEKYKDTLDDKQKQDMEYEKALSIEVEIDLMEIPESIMQKMPLEIIEPLYDIISPKPVFYTQKQLDAAIELALRGKKKK